jgi:hypothetical protein
MLNYDWSLHCFVRKKNYHSWPETKHHEKTQNMPCRYLCVVLYKRPYSVPDTWFSMWSYVDGGNVSTIWNGISRLSWGRCYYHNFLWFSTIFCEKIGVFLKNQCYDQNFALFTFVFESKRKFFRWIFWRKYFKNHNIGPGANPTITSYNASVVKIYNGVSHDIEIYIRAAGELQRDGFGRGCWPRGRTEARWTACSQLEPILRSWVTNPSVVKIYSATSSLACSESNSVLFYFEKRSSLIQRWRCTWL